MCDEEALLTTSNPKLSRVWGNDFPNYPINFRADVFDRILIKSDSLESPRDCQDSLWQS